MLTVIFMIFYFLLLFRLIFRFYRFEPISRLESHIIPAFSFIMFVLTMQWSWPNIVVLFVIIKLAIGIAFIQTQQAIIKDDSSTDSKGHPILIVRKGTSYLIGWCIIIIVSIFLPIIIQQDSMSMAHILREILHETKKELFIGAFFSQQSEWFIWALTAVTTTAYTRILPYRHLKISKIYRLFYRSLFKR